MMGLVWQELYTMRKTIRLYIVAMAVYLVMGLAADSLSMFFPCLVFFSSMLVITGFAYNEKNNWDLFANTMPVSRKQMVGSHYILMMLFIGVGFAVDILLCIGTAISSGTKLWELLAGQYAVFAVAIIYVIIFIPIIIKMGSERARIILVGLYVLPILLIKGLYDMGFSMPTEEQLHLLLAISPLVLVLGIWISFQISVIIYRKKDF